MVDHPRKFIHVFIVNLFHHKLFGTYLTSLLTNNPQVSRLLSIKASNPL